MFKMKIGPLIQILGFALLVGVFHFYLSDSSGEFKTTKILRGAKLSRDKNGIPHIEAETYQDGVFALGYAHAEDRLWQMFVGYKLALGEISEVFGAKGLEYDKFSRMLNFKSVCEYTIQNFSQEEINNLQAYTDGVNFYIDNAKILPFEFYLTKQGKPQWKKEYSCLAIKFVEYYLSSDFIREIIRDYLVMRKVFSEEELERLFPYSIEHFESQNTIIKENELKDLKIPNQQREKQKITDVYAFRKTKGQIADEEDFKRRVEFFERKKREHMEKLRKEALEKKKQEELAAAAAAASKPQTDQQTAEMIPEKLEKKDIEEKVTTSSTVKKQSPPKTEETQEMKPQLHENKRKFVKEEGEEVKLDKTIEELAKNTEHEQPIQTEEPRRPVDSASQQNIQQQINIEEHNKGDTLEVPYTKQDMHAGSNNYVFSGKLTDDGKPIIGNDPHLHTGLPGFWYMINMKIGNEYHFKGVTHPGSSCVLIGENGHVAWGITIGFGDISDFYKYDIDKVNTTDLSFVLDDDKKKHYLVNRTEIIYLKADKSDYVTEYFLDSEIGPVINPHAATIFLTASIPFVPDPLQDEYSYYFLRSTFTNKLDSNFKATMHLYKPKNANEFRNALKDITMSLSIVYADINGNIGYQLTGAIPQRKKISEGAYPHLLKSENDFTLQYIPFEELPHLENPERGYIVTGNNPVVSKDYKYILQGAFFEDSRSRTIEKNIEKHLQSGKKITVDFVMNDIINNVHDSHCDIVMKYLREINNQFEVTVHALNDLRDFNCDMRGDSKEALLYNVFITEVEKDLSYFNNSKSLNDYDLIGISINSEGRGNFLIYKLKQYVEDKALCIKEYKMRCNEFLNKAYHEARKYIVRRLGPNHNNWKWENMNIKVYDHLPFSEVPVLDMISSRRIKSDGNFNTPKVSGATVSLDNYEAKLSANLKYVTKLNGKNDFYYSIDCGNSGKLLNEHYDDLCKQHEKGKLLKMQDTPSKSAVTFTRA